MYVRCNVRVQMLFLYFCLLSGVRPAVTQPETFGPWLKPETVDTLQYLWPHLPWQHSKIASLMERYVCYTDLGCVHVTLEFFHPLHRPLNPLPLPREFINTQFILYTRKATKGHTLRANDTRSIKLSTFDTTRNTLFIIHGYLESGYRPWVKGMTKNLLEYGDYNVIVTDWEGGSQPFYVQATANIRLVGLEVAFLANTLIAKFGVDPANIHLIGHSLGAHTAGYAGEKIPGLGRITGLDPAGPSFELMPTVVRLDPTDAQFVDAIHTDANPVWMLGFGLRQPVGHVDYYVNGAYRQPGCSIVEIPIGQIPSDLEAAVEDFVFCNHRRSVSLFIDSLNPLCQYVAYECPDYDTYLKGECYSCGRDNTHCSQMGMEDMYPVGNRTNVQMYTTTGANAPYCVFHYHVKLTLPYPAEASKRVNGNLSVSLYGEKYQLLEEMLTAPGSDTFNHGQEKSFLLTSSLYVGKVQRVELQWNANSRLCDSVNCNTSLYVASVEVSELDRYPEVNRLSHTWNSCVENQKYVEMGDGTSSKFRPSACL